MSIRAAYIGLFFLLVSVCANAQYNSRLGRFQVNQVKGCVPLTVTITVNPPNQCNGSSPCDMTWGDGTAQQTVLSHTYTQAGTYTLQVLFQIVGFDDIQITVTPDTQPAFDLYACSNNEVSVRVTDNVYQQYVIDYSDGAQATVAAGAGATNDHVFATSGNKTVTVRGRNLSAADNCSSLSKNITAIPALPTASITVLQVLDASTIQLDHNAQQNVQHRLEIATNGASSFQLLKTVYNTTSETITNLRTDDNYYCFRLGVFDPCNNTTNYSPTICSANFDLAVQNNSNDLTWATSSAGISNFRLNIVSPSSQLTTTVTGSSYSDTNIICGTNYCYQLTTNYPNGSRSVSLQKCGVAISTDTPDPVINTSAIVGATGVTLEWQAVPLFTPAEFAVYRSSGAGVSLVSKTTSLQFNDGGYTADTDFCYKISYVDVCGNQSPLSGDICPIKLAASVQQDNSINLTWNAFTGWQNGVANYTLEKYSENGFLLQSFNLATATSYIDDTQDLTQQVYVYIVRATAVDAGLTASVSNRIVVIKDPNLFHPTAFTPNGDNLNDVFNVFGQYITDFEMSIFNRWGELMYTTTSLSEGWDGNFKGNPMPEGTYTFVADITDRAGRTFQKSGTVLLLRRNK